MNAQVFRFENLVITASRRIGGGYEMLVEIDKDEDAASVTVEIGSAYETIAEVEL